MKRRRTLTQSYYIWRSRYWRWQRLLFPSPAEIKFLQLMGARLYITKWIVNSKGFHFTLILSRGNILRHAKMNREMRIGHCYVDLGNDLNWVIEIDGSQHDVVVDFDREVYMREFLRKQHKDLRILRIPAYKLWHQPATVRAQVIKWLTA